jgi:hypothetical protein
MHILFPVLNIIYNVDSQEYFGMAITYNFDIETSYKILKLASVFIFITILVRFINFGTKHKEYYRINYESILYLFAFINLVVTTAMIVHSFNNQFNYGLISGNRHEISFLIELRVLSLLMLIFILDNLNFYNKKQKILIALSVLAYSIGILLFQTRGILAEFFVILFMISRIKKFDSFDFKILIITSVLIFMPNLFVYSRMGINFYENIDQLFSFEYLIVFNNILGAALDYQSRDFEFTFINQLWLIIPSFIRSILDLNSSNNEFYESVAANGGVTSGGFSLLGQLYIDFGIFYPLVIFVIMFIFHFHYKSFFLRKHNGLNFFNYIFPLFFLIIMLGLRNDFGVVLKQIFQLYIVAAFLNVFMRLKWKSYI